MALLGNQRPRIAVVPPSVSSRGREAAEHAASVGLTLDDWQRWALDGGLGVQADGRWSAFEAALLVPRQNGKTSGVLVPVMLGGLFLWGEELILYSAHEYRTAQETFLRIQTVIEGSDELRSKVKRIPTAHGEEGVELLSGQRLRFVARSRGSGRGFTGDRVIWDEAYNLPSHAVGAQMPIMSARPNPQAWYASMAPDYRIAPCDQLAAVHQRVLDGDTDELFYADWSIEPHDERCPTECSKHDEPSDRASWAKSNPSLGVRPNGLTEAAIRRELKSMGRGDFARERLGVATWPPTLAGFAVIPEPDWQAAEDQFSEPLDPVVFAADVTPDRSYGSIGMAGHRADGNVHAEVIEHRQGTRWMVDRLVELYEKWRPLPVVIDDKGPAGTLVKPLQAAGVPVRLMTARDVAEGCGLLYDAATDAKTLRHLGQTELTAAVASAKTRSLSGAWAWARQGGADISPLVAVTNAFWGVMTQRVEQAKTYHYDPYPELEAEERQQKAEPQQEQRMNHNMAVDAYGRLVA